MRDKNRPFMDVPLPQVVAPVGPAPGDPAPGGSVPDDGQASMVEAQLMEAAESACASSPPPAAEAQPPLKFQASKSRRTTSSHQTEQIEQVSINYERGPAMPASAPVSSSPSVTPVYADAPHGGGPAAGGPSNPKAWLPLLGFALAGAVVLLVSLAILWRPMADLARSSILESRKEYLEAQQRAEYQALDAEVRGAMRQMEQKLVQLDSGARSLAANAEMELGQPLQRLQANPRERPRELDLAILQSQDMAGHWAGLVNAASRGAQGGQGGQADAVYLAVQELRQRLEERKLIPADRDLAAGLLVQVVQQEELAVKRAEQVRRFTESLNARRFEETLNSTERRK